MNDVAFVKYEDSALGCAMVSSIVWCIGSSFRYFGVDNNHFLAKTRKKLMIAAVAFIRRWTHSGSEAV